MSAETKKLEYVMTLAGPVEVPAGQDPVQFSINLCGKIGQTCWVQDQKKYESRLIALRGRVFPVWSL